MVLRKRKLQISYGSREEIQDDKLAEKQIPGPVLLITITNVKYPVNAEVLFSIFNRYGEVLRAIIFDKVQGLQAMVEMASADQAQKAIEGMNG